MHFSSVHAKAVFCISVITTLALTGCSSVIVEEFSYPVKNTPPDYGLIPSHLPRRVDGLPNWVRRDFSDLREVGFYMGIEMSNSVETQNGDSRTAGREKEPLVIRVHMAPDRKGVKGTLRNVTGNISLLSGGSLRPTRIFADQKPHCGGSASDILNIGQDEFLLDDALDENRWAISGNGRISGRSACLVFEYPASVSVDSVFTVDFGELLLPNGETRRLDIRFYPLIRRYIQHK